MRTRLGCSMVLAILLVVTVTPTTSNGHKTFEKEMEKSFKDGGVNASCTLCHVAKEEKTTRNNFGKLFAKEFEGKNLSKNWNEMERADQKVYETETMAPAFREAWAKIKKQKPKESDATYESLIREFKMDGVKEKKKKSK